MPVVKGDHMPTVPLYQPFSADEEQKTSVIIEPEESAGYTVVSRFYMHLPLIPHYSRNLRCFPSYDIKARTCTLIARTIHKLRSH